MAKNNEILPLHNISVREYQSELLWNDMKVELKSLKYSKKSKKKSAKKQRNVDPPPFSQLVNKITCKPKICTIIILKK
jgi:hypothetical protein